MTFALCTERDGSFPGVYADQGVCNAAAKASSPPWLVSTVSPNAGVPPKLPTIAAYAAPPGATAWTC